MTYDLNFDLIRPCKVACLSCRLQGNFNRTNLDSKTRRPRKCLNGIHLKEPKSCKYSQNRRRNLVNVYFFLVNGFQNLNRSQMKDMQTMHSMVETNFMPVEPLFDENYK